MKGVTTMSEPSTPDSPTRERVPLVRLAKGQEASLGCGTLILIALIVAFCSGGIRTPNLTPLEHRLDEIDRRLDRLERKIDEMKKVPAEKER
jgi:hypothetical protein